MGRASSCGRRQASPISARTRKAGQRAQHTRGAAFSITALPEPVDSCSRLAPRLNLDVVVQFVVGVPVAIEADITALRALGVDQLALVGFDVIQILSCAKADLVFEVIVEN